MNEVFKEKDSKIISLLWDYFVSFLVILTRAVEFWNWETSEMQLTSHVYTGGEGRLKLGSEI